MVDDKTPSKAPEKPATTGSGPVDVDAGSAVEQAAQDSVFAVSRHADGTPAQSEGFTSVDPEATAAISEAQLREQAASAVDYLHRSKAAVDEDVAEPDPAIKALADTQEKAADAAANKVEKL